MDEVHARAAQQPPLPRRSATDGGPGTPGAEAPPLRRAGSPDGAADAALLCDLFPTLVGELDFDGLVARMGYAAAYDHCHTAAAWQLHQQAAAEEELEVLRQQAAARKRDNAQQRAAAADEVQHAAAAPAQAVAAPMQPQAPQIAAPVCCLNVKCPEQLTAFDGMYCCADADGGHFTCDACLTEYAEQQAQAPPGALARDGCKLRCPMGPACASSPPFDVAQLARRLPSAGFEALVDAMGRARDLKQLEQTNKDHEDQMRAKERELQAAHAAVLANAREADAMAVQAALAARVQELRRDVADRILTEHCPGCNAAFANFEGCCAVKCARCKTAFCAWCLDNCGRDAHAHVANCEANLMPKKDVWGTPELLDRARRMRRTNQLRNRLRRLEPVARLPLLEALHAELGGGANDMPDAQQLRNFCAALPDAPPRAQAEAAAPPPARVGHDDEVEQLVRFANGRL